MYSTAASSNITSADKPKSSDAYQERTWNWSRHKKGFQDMDILLHTEAKIQTAAH